jgi:hypothetical protein
VLKTKAANRRKRRPVLDVVGMGVAPRRSSASKSTTSCDFASGRAAPRPRSSTDDGDAHRASWASRSRRPLDVTPRSLAPLHPACGGRFLANPADRVATRGGRERGRNRSRERRAEASRESMQRPRGGGPGAVCAATVTRNRAVLGDSPLHATASVRGPASGFDGACPQDTSEKTRRRRVCEEEEQRVSPRFPRCIGLHGRVEEPHSATSSGPRKPLRDCVFETRRRSRRRRVREGRRGSRPPRPSVPAMHGPSRPRSLMRRLPSNRYKL